MPGAFEAVLQTHSTKITWFLSSLYLTEGLCSHALFANHLFQQSKERLSHHKMPGRKQDWKILPWVSLHNPMLLHTIMNNYATKRKKSSKKDKNQNLNMVRHIHNPTIPRDSKVGILFARESSGTVKPISQLKLCLILLLPHLTQSLSL